MKLTVKNIQSCMGRNGPGTAFSCSLYIDGKRAALVRNDGNGGCNMYDWLDRSLEQPFLEHCALLHPEIKYEAEDHVVVALFDAVEEDRTFKRSCRTKTLFRLASDGEDNFRTAKIRWQGNEDHIRERLQKRHGDDLVEIINERYA